MLVENGAYLEHASITWSAECARRFKVELGSPKGQTTWEYLVVLLALEVWADRYRDVGVAILGDNLAAISGALALKGRADLSLVTREIAWRKVRRRWFYACGHLPAEFNDVADALSRLSAPEGNNKKFPPELASSRARVPGPRVLVGFITFGKTTFLKKGWGTPLP